MDKPKGAPLIADVPRATQNQASPPAASRSRDVVAVEGALVAVDIPLREQPGRIHVKAPAGADVWVDLRLTGKTPLGGPLQVTPGRRVLWIAKAGHVPREVVVNVKRGQDKDVAVQLSQTTERIAATVLFVGAGAAAITGGVFTALSSPTRRRPLTQTRLDEQPLGVACRLRGHPTAARRFSRATRHVRFSRQPRHAGGVFAFRTDTAAADPFRDTEKPGARNRGRSM
jgi:hypothetical protein